ncbi:MAG: molybdopterin-dependent oxidoreductase [Actinomycetota bacterium]|nr:molybdopterin-dependent oxidoreductase [Actinomycetota bacterium]
MAGRRTNLALLSALLLAFLTGVLAFAAGTGWGVPVVVAHGVAGLCLLVLAPWKSVVARRGLARRARGAWPSIAFTLLVVASLVFGIVHSLGLAPGLSFLTPMQVHVGAALLALPFALHHLWYRRVPPRRTDLSRRNLVRGLGVVGGGALLYLFFESVARLADLPGARRRFTGSHEEGSFDPDRMPVTQWLNDQVPLIDAERWVLKVRSGGQRRDWTYDELVEHQAEVIATLDCTGGWFATQEWTGVPLSRLLPPTVSGRSVSVESTTGYARRFPVGDLETLFLATGIAGSPLSPGHGYPVRLVAPGRRGFWWVKWVDSVVVDDRPWWLQLPFPAE